LNPGTRVESINFRMEGHAAHTNMQVTVVSPSGREVMKKSYPDRKIVEDIKAGNGDWSK